MRRIRLPHTTLETSTLGFGCNPLTTMNDRRKAIALLESAYESGITHFDVARAYGSGATEGIVGEFLQGKRDRVTVTTKFGLRPAAVVRSAGMRSLAKRVLRLVPAIDRRVRARINQAAPRYGTFGLAESAESLETSLRELRTDHVDMLLLHEARITDAQNEELQRFLEDQVQRGTVRYWGIGTHHANLEEDARRLPASCTIVQMENDAVARQRSAILGLDERAVITHSSLRPLSQIAAAAASDFEATAVIREMTDLDVTRRDDAARLLLGFALADNPDGMVLVGTTKAENAAANARMAGRPLDAYRAPAVLAAVRRLAASSSATRA